MEFKEWFCLKDRDSFTIDPKISPSDAQFYFGRPREEGRLKAQLRRSFIDPGVPKMMVWGPYGSGKTQTLYHLEHSLRNSKPDSCKLTPRTVHLDLEIQSKSDCGDWHLQLLEATGKETVSRWVDSLFSRAANFDTELRQVFSDPNAVEAVKNLRAGGEVSLTAWRWLVGQQLSTKELEGLKATRNLGQIGAGDMVNVLVGVGRLAEKNGEKLIFLIDETEQFGKVRSADAAESLHDYLRKLCENSNSSVGLVMGCFGLTLNDMPPILVRPDIRSRMGEQNYVEIPPLPAVQDVKTFVQEMLKHLIDQPKAEARIQDKGLGITLETYPFTASSFELLCDYASQDPVKALPRNLIKAINECAIAAWDEKKEIVDDPIINDIAYLVFG